MNFRLSSILFIALSLRAQQSAPSPVSELTRTIRDAVDTDRALQTVKDIYSTDRWFTFPKFEETAVYLKNRLEAGGARDVVVGGAPADGVTQVGFWTMPLAWDVRQASLELIAPEALSLCEYKETPSCLGMWSGPTPREGVVAELVDLASTPWDQVRGKLVLTERNSAGLKHLLVQHGALGAVNGWTENPALGSGRQWVNAWGDNGWGFLKTSTPLLSYSVSPDQVRRLRALLARGEKVSVRAKADIRYYAGRYPWVTGLLRGNGSEEVLVLGHTSEQGAQDNATGVATSVEALATLNRLISAGKLPKPKRSIRVLLMPELYGSLSYLSANAERMARTVAAMTVDTPAAAYEFAGTEYTFYRNPQVAKSWTDALIVRIAQASLPKGRPWHVSEHTTGTDAYLGEPTVGVPDVWVYSGTGPVTHHNSEDTPATVDVRSLRDLTATVASYLYYAANAGSAELPWLTNITLDAGLEDLRLTAAKGVDAVLAGKPDNAGFELTRLSYLVERNSEALLSLKRLLPAMERSGANKAIAEATALLQEFCRAQKSRLEALGVKEYTRAKDALAAAIIVRRKRIGSIPLDDLDQNKWEGFPSGAWDKTVTVALYWCDGKRNLEEVIRLTEMEVGHPVQFNFAAYFRFLQRHGYVDFVS